MNILQDHYDLSKTIDCATWLRSVDSANLYVYLHLDNEGVPFYAGRGRNDRAWTVDGGSAWRWFVEHHMGGEVPVCILSQNLDEYSSEDLLEQVKTRHGLSLLIRANGHRGMDYKALDAYWEAKKNLRPYYDMIRNEKDDDIRLDIAIEAQEQMYQLDTYKTEHGRFGAIADEMCGASNNVNSFFIKYVVEGLMLQGKVEEASEELDRFKRKKGRGNIDRLEKIVARGTYKRRPRKDKADAP